MKIAICGKGGVGKSTICAFVIKALEKRGHKVLAIDADPSPHLARLLAFSEADKITPIAEMKDLLMERSQRQGAFYSLNPKVEDLPEKFMLTKGNIKLMVLGAIQQGGAGCACAENTVLRTLLNILLLSPEEDIVVDTEAGVEHLGRGTIVSVDHLLVVVQPYRGSLETAKKIKNLAQDLRLRHLYFVANNIRDKEDLVFIQEGLSTKVIGTFPWSRQVMVAERQESSICESSPEMLIAAERLVTRLENEDGQRL